MDIGVIKGSKLYILRGLKEIRFEDYESKLQTDELEWGIKIYNDDTPHLCLYFEYNLF